MLGRNEPQVAVVMANEGGAVVVPDGVTQDARAAAIADRILFLDGLIGRDLPRSERHDVLEAMEELAAR